MAGLTARRQVRSGSSFYLLESERSVPGKIVATLRQGCAALRHGPSRLAACSVSIMATLGAVSETLWRFRRSCSIALSVGLIAGVVGYCAGPIISSMLCGLSGMALTLSSMILLPLWRLLNWNISDASN